MTKPQRIDFHQRDVPRPIDVRGNRSPRPTMNNRVIALTQSSVSFQIAAVKVRVGQKYETDRRTSNIANSDRNTPSQVVRKTSGGNAALPELRRACSPMALVCSAVHGAAEPGI